MFNTMKERLQETASQMIATSSEQLVEIVPKVLLALFVLVVGYIVARVVRKIVLHVFDFFGLDKLACKVNMDKALRSIGIKRNVSGILGFLVFWLILLVALLLMSEALDLGAVSEAIGAIVAYIPHLIAGLLILVIGLLLGRFLRDIVSTSLARTGIAASEILGVIVQVIIVIFVCLLALKQVGFDVSVITTNVSVILGVLLVSIGLAIALAVRPVLENIFACRQLRSSLQVGDQIGFDGVEGEVKSFSLSNVVIQDGNKEIVVPARLLFEQRFSRTSKN
jgi:small-conductance mechanosensitive channel